MKRISELVLPKQRRGTDSDLSGFGWRVLTECDCRGTRSRRRDPNPNLTGSRPLASPPFVFPSTPIGRPENRYCKRERQRSFLRAEMEEDGGGGLGFMELLSSGASVLLFDGSASSSMVCFSGKQEEEKENSKCCNVSENSKKIAGKRPKTECPASATSFHGGTKRRKEKLGDRITALQQLVSPFSKSDTATVLHEALGYIRFLHDQVQVLSSPYLKNLQSVDEIAAEVEEARRIDDLRSRGLCLVPVSCAEHVTSSNGADFWSPTMATATGGSKSSSSISKH